MSQEVDLASKLGGYVGEVGGEDLNEYQVGGVGYLEAGKVEKVGRM